MNYLSSVKRQLETTVRTELFKKESEWYRRRRNLHQQYASQAIKTGKRLKDHAPMMTLEDLEVTSKALFLQNRPTALMDRTLLNNRWLTIGRSSDVGNLLFDDLHWLGRFLVIDLTRLKVRQQHSVSIFCSPGKRTIDPFHSLASQLVADPCNASHRVFSQITKGKTETRIAAHINRVLKSLYQTDAGAVLTPGRQSHSARRGGAIHASSHGDVKLSDLAYRGLWSMDGFATLLEYISPTSASEQTIAKVLGGWADPERAGSPPSLSCFLAHHHEAKARVAEFAATMRRLYFSKLAKQGFADCLTATLLMYFDETLAVASDHIVHTNMLACSRQMRTRMATVEELKGWGRFIRKHFVLENPLSLPVQRGIAGYREVVAELQDVKTMLHRVLDGMHALQLSRGQEQCACTHQSLHDTTPQYVRLQPTSQLSNDTQPRPGHPTSLLGRPWPQDFTSLRSMLLQDQIIRYVRDGLAFAAYDPTNRVQKEVQSAIQIVKEFVELASLPSGHQPASEALTLAHSHASAAFARRVQRAVVDFIEAKRPRPEAKKRQRLLTGMVSGVVRAWGPSIQQVARRPRCFRNSALSTLHKSTHESNISACIMPPMSHSRVVPSPSLLAAVHVPSTHTSQAGPRATPTRRQPRPQGPPLTPRTTPTTASPQQHDRDAQQQRRQHDRDNQQPRQYECDTQLQQHDRDAQPQQQQDHDAEPHRATVLFVLE